MVGLIASQEQRIQRIVDALRQTQTAVNSFVANLAGYVTTATHTANLALKADKVGSVDVEVTDATKGIILKSPNGTRWRIQVTNAGGLTATSI